MTTTTAPPQRMTGDEFLRIYGDRSGYELVDGQLVELEMPGLLHGEICVNASSIFRDFVKKNKLGRVCGNDSFIRTRSLPDAFRGPDVLYMSYETYAADLQTPKGTFTPPLELVIEVKSPSESFNSLFEKARCITFFTRSPAGRAEYPLPADGPNQQRSRLDRSQ